MHNRFKKEKPFKVKMKVQTCKYVTVGNNEMIDIDQYFQKVFEIIA